MSDSISPGTGRIYGVERVCRVWSFSRSTYYAQVGRQPTDMRQQSRRGPKPKIPDSDLLSAIHNDLDRSPWYGEGHRKVWARLRVLDEIRVGRNRVLRLMKENQLLSPHRGRPVQERVHDGHIITAAPDIMWGTDGARVLTAEDGWVWVFFAVDHWNAECVGWHVSKIGTRYEALEPISMALTNHYGHVHQNAGKGLKLRMDHGSQYMADHFQKQIEYWGIEPSFSFVAQPETNGVVERFNRTFKEQIVHGQIHRNVKALREATREFVGQYNDQWILEKNGYRSPRQTRQEWMKAQELDRAA